MQSMPSLMANFGYSSFYWLHNLPIDDILHHFES